MVVARAEYNYYPEPIEVQKPKEVTKKKKKVRTINKSMYMWMAIIFLITSLFILYGYSKITAVRIEITQLEKEKVELEKVKQDLAGKLEGIKSTTKISEEAKNNLGMIYPEEGQIVYVTVNDTDDVFVDNASVTEHLRRFLSIFSSLF